MRREHMDICPFSKKREHVVVDITKEATNFTCDNSTCTLHGDKTCAVYKMYSK